MPRWLWAVLRVPLVGKIAGANGLIVVAALLAGLFTFDDAAAGPRFMLLLAAALSLSLLVSVVLVLIALRPLDDLESTAKRIWRGDLSARVPTSPVADPDLQRVGNALNVLLDGLAADRARMRALASQVISAGDRERASIARELHDSTAQTLAALLLELSVLVAEIDDPAAITRIERVRDIVRDVLEEVKLLAHTVHPRVLEDLGLTAALRLLAREAELYSQLRVTVESETLDRHLAPDRASVLYRVAQEGLNNALRHSRGTTVALRLSLRSGVVRLEVDDNGTGFDVGEAERRRPGMGLFTMRERTSLVGGALEITSEKGRGTRLVATVPMTENNVAAGTDGSA
jgi:signal transduction histidine kinase